MSEKKYWQIAFTSFIFLLSAHMRAQDIKLEEVTYYPPEITTGWVTIIPDYVIGPTKSTTSVKAWINASSPVARPVAYVSGYKAKVGARFSCPWETCHTLTIYVKAEAVGLDYKLPSKQLNANYEYPISEVDKEFPKYVVRYFPNFTWEWSYTTTPDIATSWKLVRMSTNELLVTHKEPYQEHNAADLLSNFEQPTTFYYSSLAIGCNAADGKGADPSGNSDDPDKVVEAIFTPFRNSCVTKVNSTSCMTYWGNYNQLDPNDPNCSGIHGLLDNEDAHCGEWAAFFQDMLKLQGIITGKPHLVTYQIKDGDIGYLDALTTAKLNNATHTFFENKEDNVGWQTIGGDYVAYFFVKEYNFQPFNANGENFYLYKQEPRPAPPTTPEQFVITTQSGNKTLKEANQYGIEGQGHVKDPNSVFFNHVIVSYKQKNETVGFLDPSYGTPASGYYSDENAYETESFSGFGAYGLYVEGSIEKMIIWINALNDNNPQLHFTP